MLIFVAFLTYILNATFGKRCPPIFGQFECPLNYTCTIDDCYSTNNAVAPNDCKQVKCSTNSRCYKGRCYPTPGLPCNRNIELSENQFKSITSNCGLNGKCVNGRCVEDRCLGVRCTENEICRDGRCLVVTNNFCITHFDCGPIFKCRLNKCVPLRKPVPCNCDPSEVCQYGQCIQEPSCSHVSCAKGSFCLKGVCQTAVGRDCTTTACEGGTICVEGKCILDPCTNRCPSDHTCREGQCRHLQGLQCYTECPTPYACIDGFCTRNECSGKSCKAGEVCQNGLCIKIEGRLCSLAIRDCAEQFECIDGICRDLFS
uniref:Uncharacterized protein n=1 Tax=Setaria digitata TaxID=48799 RepID=A0A915PFY7_9BILA